MCYVYMLMKTKGQQPNLQMIKLLAYCFLGLWEGSRSGILGARSRGFDSLQVHPYPRILPANGCNRLRGMSSGMSRRQGWKPAVILAQQSEESKGQNDVPQLQDRMPKIWEDRQRPATVSLLPVPQDLFRPARRAPGRHVHGTRESRSRNHAAR